MSDYISIAARLVREAPANLGDPPMTGAELDRLGDLMRDASVMLRLVGDENDRLRKLVKETKSPDVCRGGVRYGKNIIFRPKWCERICRQSSFTNMVW